jgi:hypothetical protein
LPVANLACDPDGLRVIVDIVGVVHANLLEAAGMEPTAAFGDWKPQSPFGLRLFSSRRCFDRHPVGDRQDSGVRFLYMVVLALEIGAFLASPLVECCLRFVIKLRRFCQRDPELEL